MRYVLADNVVALMDRKFGDRENKPGALAKAAGLSLSTVQRTISAESGASVDTIESLALALDVFPYQLLLPELDVQSSPSSRLAQLPPSVDFTRPSTASGASTRLLTERPKTG